MTLTENDLRELLAGHVGQQPENGARLPEVRDRIGRARRRRRALTAGTLAAVVAGGIAVAGVTGGGHRTSVEPAGPATTAYPTYAHGGRALGGGTITAPGQTTLTFTVVPTSYELFLETDCDGGAALSVSVGGAGYATRCDGDAGYGTTVDPQIGAAQWDGIRLGQPNTVTLTLSAAGGGTGGVDGTVTAAMYQGVPFDQYPLPTVPGGYRDPLPADPVVVRPTRTRTTGTFTGTIAVTPARTIAVETDGPGILDVSVAGHHVRTVGAFDWTQAQLAFTPSASYLGSLGIHATVGQTLPITVTATHFTGAYWQIAEQDVPGP